MKITEHEWNKYRKKALFRPLEPLTPPPVFGRFIVIPVMDELEELPDTLKSLSLALNRPLSTSTGILLVVNHPPDTPEKRRAADETLLRQLRTAAPELLQELIPGETLFWIDAASAGNELLRGVGEARRIGLDCALTLLAPEQREEAFLCCLDADSPVAPDYLERLEECFLTHPEAGAVSIAVRHRPGKTAAEESAIRAYERYMADYVARLKEAGSPYAFHTIGSAMAVRVPVYIAAGGMRVRSGAEDFYFLQAVRKIAPVIEYPEPLVFPAARPSDRVPFGTGPAIRAQLAGQPLPEYANTAFAALKILLKAADDEILRNIEKFDEKVTDPIRHFLRQHGFYTVWPSVIRNLPARNGAARQAFDRWFDGLKTLQFLKSYQNSAPDSPAVSGGSIPDAGSVREKSRDFSGNDCLPGNSVLH